MIRIAIRPTEFASAMYRRGLKRKDLAKRVNVTGAYIGMLLRGYRHPSPPLANRICDELNVSWDDIFYTQHTDTSKEADKSNGRARHRTA